MEDVGDLAKIFTLQIGGANFKISDRAIHALSSYDWPGNIRELRNAVERAVISARKRRVTEISFDDVSISTSIKDAAYRIRKLESALPRKLSDLTPEKYQEFLEDVEREYLNSALEAADGSAAEVANRIGLGRSTVFKKLKTLGCGDESNLNPIVITSRLLSRQDKRGHF
jgi:DNA-binding NtrC family response regulator